MPPPAYQSPPAWEHYINLSLDSSNMASVHYDIPLDFLPDNDGVIDHHSPLEQLEPDATLCHPIVRSVGDIIPFVHCTRPSIRHLSSASSALRLTEQVVGVHDRLLPYLTLPTLYFCVG